jgi:hypothetical protein
MSLISFFGADIGEIADNSTLDHFELVIKLTHNVVFPHYGVLVVPLRAHPEHFKLEHCSPPLEWIV